MTLKKSVSTLEVPVQSVHETWGILYEGYRKYTIKIEPSSLRKQFMLDTSETFDLDCLSGCSVATYRKPMQFTTVCKKRFKIITFDHHKRKEFSTLFIVLFLYHILHFFYYIFSTKRIRESGASISLLADWHFYFIYQFLLSSLNSFFFSSLALVQLRYMWIINCFEQTPFSLLTLIILSLSKYAKNYDIFTAHTLRISYCSLPIAFLWIFFLYNDSWNDFFLNLLSRIRADFRS